MHVKDQEEIMLWAQQKLSLFMDKLHTMGKSSQQKIIRSSRECWAARFPGAGGRTGGTDNVTDWDEREEKTKLALESRNK